MSHFFALVLVFLGLPVGAAYRDSLGARLFLESENFVSQDYQATEDRQFTFLGAQYQTPGLLQPDQQGNFELSAAGRFSPSEPMLSSLNVSELFTRQGHFRLGRKKVTWSELDSNWSQGIYQPQFRASPLDPTEQGLFGLFWSIPLARGFTSTLFASAFAVPHQYPSYALKDDGQFRPINPWFEALPESVVFAGSGNRDRIIYEVEDRGIQDLLIKQSFAAAVEWQNTQWKLRLAGAYKPSPEIVMGLNPRATQGEAIRMRVLPMVQYHRVLSADLIYSPTDTTAIGLSHLQESPEAPQVEPSGDWTYFAKQSQSSQSLWSQVEWRQLQFHFGLLTSRGGGGQLRGPQADFLSGRVPENRPLFESGWQTKVSYDWRLPRSAGLELSLRYYRSQQGGTELVDSQLNYHIDSQWSVFTSLLLVAGDQETSSVLDVFQDRDFLRAGVTHVF